MPKINTLKKNGYFRRAYARGKSFTDPALVTYVIKNGAGIRRIGITTGRKLGNAVERNRCKRIIKAAYMMLDDRLKSGYDIVFVARHRTVYKKSTDLYKIMSKQFKDAGILKAE
ncbi:MAG: ribonuclease P protein component [Clostridia bacterium]|nr:ribonuclease P protein component [Clostridia bacterium]MBQ6708709.1 ribonuclease P protein component [Clostridia bacterium]